MLSEARKYGLNLTMAQQSAQQKGSQKLTEVLLANIGSLITFRTNSPADTNLLTPFYEPFIAKTDLANAPSRSFYLKTVAIEAEAPVSVKTKLPISPPKAKNNTVQKRKGLK